MNTNNGVGIVILNYNTYDLTINLIKNISDVINYKDLEIVVVDNNSTNQSANELALFAKHSPIPFELIISSINKGYAAGNNIGCRYLVGKGVEYILIVNNDIQFLDPNTIDLLISSFNNDAIGVVSPKLIKPDGVEDFPVYYKRPTFFDLSFGYFFFVKNRKVKLGEYREMYAPRGSCMMLQSRLLKAINYLDEHTFLYYEEPILAEKLISLNKKCIYNGLVSIIHDHGKTISNNISRKSISGHILDSLKYYLEEYRNFDTLQIWFCIVTKIVYFYLKLLLKIS